MSDVRTRCEEEIKLHYPYIAGTIEVFDNEDLIGMSANYGQFRFASRTMIKKENGDKRIVETIKELMNDQRDWVLSRISSYDFKPWIDEDKRRADWLSNG